MRQILKILFLFSTTIFVNQYKNHTNILINIKIVGHTQIYFSGIMPLFIIT